MCMQRTWHIKYYTPDYTTGKMRPRKYYGLLNIETDFEKRKALAAQYLHTMQTGVLPPSYRGQRYMPQQHHTTTNFASIEVCIAEFMKHTTDLRTATLWQYNNRFKIFVEYIHTQQLQHTPIGAWHESMCADFLHHLRTVRNLSAKTTNDYKRLLGSLWHFHRKKINGHNPWREMKSAKQHSTPLLAYSNDVRTTIANTLPQHNPQLWLFLQCVYYCALRPHSELRLLQRQHINLQSGTITVPAHISKTHRQRTITIPNLLLQQLQAPMYASAPPNAYLFTIHNSPGEKPASINYFKYKWQQYRTAAAIPDCYKLYGSKHTAGQDLSTLFNSYITQQHFGHSSIRSTEHYTNNLQTEKLNFLKTEHPKF